MSQVKRVWGKLDNKDVVEFSYDEATGNYTAEVPKPERGYYTVELFAEDYAGSQAYAATMVVTLDPETGKMAFRLLNVRTKLSFA